MAIKEENFEDDKKTNDKSPKSPNVLEAEFIPPDGGWGWMIVIAAGFSNFCVLPVLQSFGLIFRDRFAQIGINSSQITTILNVNIAVTSCVGLANGPVFRKYSCRQVSLVGGLLSVISICALSFTKTFHGILIFLSILYGAGIGITMSAGALALNTYFKKRRRIATGLSWTCTGLGPIIMPQIVTLLMPIYGVSGTVLIFGGFAFNAVACALLMQPVEKHAKKESGHQAIKTVALTETTKEKVDEENVRLTNGNGKTLSFENILRLDKLANIVDNRSSQLFGSQYLYYDDEDGPAGIDVIAMATPMMSRANDGWFSKRNASYASLASNRAIKKECTQSTSRRPSISLSRQPSLMALSRGNSVRNLSRQSSDADGRKRKISTHQNAVPQLIIVKESCESDEQSQKIIKENVNDETERHLLTRNESFRGNEMIMEENDEIIPAWYARAFNAIVVFFDLDLLRDPVYVNLLIGINLANFAELNFSLLTPFILGEHGLSKNEVATIMSVLAGVDVFTRITIPFIATRIGWENRTFFLIGIGIIAVARLVIAHVGSYGVVMAVGVLIGSGKALKTIFMALVIPTHVPLHRLPAASGLQLVTSGFMFLACGPIVGWIRDMTGSFTIVLHWLNVLTCITIISWSLEVWYRNRKRRGLEGEKVAPI